MLLKELFENSIGDSNANKKWRHAILDIFKLFSDHHVKILSQRITPTDLSLAVNKESFNSTGLQQYLCRSLQDIGCELSNWIEHDDAITITMSIRPILNTPLKENAKYIVETTSVQWRHAILDVPRWLQQCGITIINQEVKPYLMKINADKTNRDIISKNTQALHAMLKNYDCHVKSITPWDGKIEIEPEYTPDWQLVQIMCYGINQEGTSNKIWGYARKGDKLIKFWGKNIVGRALHPPQVFSYPFHESEMIREIGEKSGRGYKMVRGEPTDQRVKNWIVDTVNSAV
jgi:hypothetical protein